MAQSKRTRTTGQSRQPATPEPGTPEPGTNALPEGESAAGAGPLDAGNRLPGEAGPRRVEEGIEALDRQLLALLNRRAEAYRQAAREQDEGERESDAWAHLNRLVADNPGPLETGTIRAIFRELLSGSRQLLRRIRVAYLGPPYSYSHLAAIERFGESVELVPAATIRAVFESLERAEVHFGLVPVENSTDGRVVDTLDMFARRPVRICGEVRLRIHHCLLGNCLRGEVREVYSKPQALSQCRDWLARHLPAARTVEMASTAAAAQLAVEKPGAAAIASRQAGMHYGLQVIDANIEDNRHNVTRFAVIGDDQPRRTGRDKTSLMFELPHQPGALADAMAIFKRNRLNLTWIESFPMPDTPNEYLFFVELEGHRDEMKVKRALGALEGKTERLEVLGSYAGTQPVG